MILFMSMRGWRCGRSARFRRCCSSSIFSACGCAQYFARSASASPRSTPIFPKSLSGMAVIQLFTRERESRREFDELNLQSREVQSDVEHL